MKLLVFQESMYFAERATPSPPALSFLRSELSAMLAVTSPVLLVLALLFLIGPYIM